MKTARTQVRKGRHSLHTGQVWGVAIRFSAAAAPVRCALVLDQDEGRAVELEGSAKVRFAKPAHQLELRVDQAEEGEQLVVVLEAEGEDFEELEDLR